MDKPQVPAGFKEKRTISGGVQITSWIQDDPGGDTRKEVYGVFNGGGAKGAAFGGAIEVYEQQVRWKEVSGASAGAITGALLAAGYDGSSIAKIINEIKFQELLDPFPLEEVKESAYQWQFEEDVDYLTTFLAKIDPSLLTPKATDEMRRKVVDFQKQKERDEMWFYERWSEDMSSKVLDPVWKTISQHGVSWGTYLGSKLAGVDEAKADALFYGAKSLYSTNQEELQENVANMLMSILGKNLPAALQGTMQTKDGKMDPEKTLSVLLGIYYKGGAFKGANFLNLMEGYLQKALRPEGEYNPDDPKPYDRANPDDPNGPKKFPRVTFRELPIPLHVMTSDISQNRLCRIPDDLPDYGYGRDGASDPMDFSVAEAVRASMSLPLIYAPFYLPHQTELDGESTYSALVDGGMLSNFPIGEFGEQQADTPICGFWLGPNPDLAPVVSTDRISTYGFGLLNSMMVASDKNMMERFGDKIVLTVIGMEIPLSKEEEIWEKSAEAKEKKAKAAKPIRKRIGELNKIIDELDETENDLNEDKSELPDREGMVEYLQRKRGLYLQSVTDLQEQLDELEKTDNTGRECSTLDFALDLSQKEALTNNGREAARESIKKLDRN